MQECASYYFDQVWAKATENQRVIFEQTIQKDQNCIIDLLYDVINDNGCCRNSFYWRHSIVPPFPPDVLLKDKCALLLLLGLHFSKQHGTPFVLFFNGLALEAFQKRMFEFVDVLFPCHPMKKKINDENDLPFGNPLPLCLMFTENTLGTLIRASIKLHVDTSHPNIAIRSFEKNNLAQFFDTTFSCILLDLRDHKHGPLFQNPNRNTRPMDQSIQGYLSLKRKRTFMLSTGGSLSGEYWSELAFGYFVYLECGAIAE